MVLSGAFISLVALLLPFSLADDRPARKGGRGGVWCGGHRAASCDKCPQGHGPAWCNGDCQWWIDECIPVAPQERQHNFPHPPDTRPAGCPVVTADLSDHKVSIIIPWLKETWEHLEGTLRALVHFTPDDLVEEYLFISDGNEDTKEKELVEISPKVKVLALPKREGLIRAKMKGVALARAPVLMFMEAHCIVNRNWLEPLLQRVKQEPKALVMPALDGIPADNWHGYEKGSLGALWRYEWNLNLIQVHPYNRSYVEGPEVYMSPGTSGGIFAMRKDWFEHLEFFDPGLYEWGGDHFELTMKVWRCGGRIEVAPCSRIGHLFRTPVSRPYHVEVTQVVSNYKRLAVIWLKDHYHYFDIMKPEARDMDVGDLEELRQKHDKLGCKDMQWYLDNVDFEMAWEMDKLCHPFVRVDDPIKCKESDLVPGRWTLRRKDLITPEEYFRRRDAASAASAGAPSPPSSHGSDRSEL